MIRRPSIVIAAILATILALLTAIPALGYGYANQYHLRLYRLDPIRCGTPITLKAELVNVRPPRGRGAHYRGHWVSEPVAGATVNFEVAIGAPGDVVSPSSAVTNARGRAFTDVTLDCSVNHHRVVAYAPEYRAGARITLITWRPRAQYGPWQLLTGGASAASQPGWSLFSSLFGPFGAQTGS